MRQRFTISPAISKRISTGKLSLTAMLVIGSALHSGVTSASAEGVAQTSGSAESSRRGLVTSAACPFTCEDARVPREFCRERSNGVHCEVEDLSQPPGHRSMIRIPASAVTPVDGAPVDGAPVDGAPQPVGSSLVGSSSVGSDSAARPAESAANRRGLVTSAACPYSCALAKLPSDLCREWSSGDKCFVEDFTQAPGHRSMIRIP